MNHISDSVRLMSLIVKTKPFVYNNETNTLSCEYSTHLNIDDLKNLKSELEVLLQNIPEGSPESTSTILKEDIDLINTVIITLENN